MRAVLCLALLVGCAPTVDPKRPVADVGEEDLPRESAAAAPSPAVADPARPEAPAGKGLRTGIIERAKLIAVLDHGPGEFLRQLEVTPHKQGERFVGWQLVQVIDHAGMLADIDVAPGDVLLAVNGRPLSRPDQLQTLWDSLRTANEVVADLWRGNGKLQLRFAIEPKVAP